MLCLLTLFLDAFTRIVDSCLLQVPDASISVPAVTGTMPDVSGDVSVPSVGGVDVDVAAPSVDVDASLPSASVDVPGECKTKVVGLFIWSFRCGGSVNQRLFKSSWVPMPSEKKNEECGIFIVAARSVR